MLLQAVAMDYMSSTNRRLEVQQFCSDDAKRLQVTPWSSRHIYAFCLSYAFIGCPFLFLLLLLFLLPLLLFILLLFYPSFSPPQHDPNTCYKHTTPWGRPQRLAGMFTEEALEALRKQRANSLYGKVSNRNTSWTILTCDRQSSHLHTFTHSSYACHPTTLSHHHTRIPAYPHIPLSHPLAHTLISPFPLPS